MDAFPVPIPLLSATAATTTVSGLIEFLRAATPILLVDCHQGIRPSHRWGSNEFLLVRRG